MAGRPKRCTKCKQKKELREFNKCSRSKDGRVWECKECSRKRLKQYEIDNKEKVKARRKQWNKDNPDKYKQIVINNYKNNKTSVKNRHLKRLYGLDYNEYSQIKKQQKGKCAICGEKENGMFNGERKELSVDHNHETGKIRALLCSKCNTAIGLLNENAELCQRVADYLRRHKEIRIASA